MPRFFESRGDVKKFRVRAIDARPEQAISEVGAPGVVGAEVHYRRGGAGRRLGFMRHRWRGAGKDHRDVPVRVYRAQLLVPADVVRVEDGAGSGNPSGSRPNSAVGRGNEIVKPGAVEIEGDDVESIVAIDQSDEGASRNDAEM